MKKSNLIVRWPVHGDHDGEMSYFLKLIDNLFKKELTNDSIDKWLENNLNDNRKVANLLERKVIHEFKFFVPEMRFGDRPFIDYIFFLKWNKSYKIIDPLIEKIEELEKERLFLYYEVTQMDKTEWVKTRGKLIKEVKKWFLDYNKKYLKEIIEYEKEHAQYRKNLAEGKFI